MPLILNIETATKICSVALARDGEIISFRETGRHYSHSELLTTFIQEVMDETGLKGYASCEIMLEEGETSYPVTLNFVGDIMLARGYEQNGGIIQTQGVEAIFEPTLEILGDQVN